MSTTSNFFQCISSNSKQKSLYKKIYFLSLFAMTSFYQGHCSASNVTTANIDISNIGSEVTINKNNSGRYVIVPQLTSTDSHGVLKVAFVAANETTPAAGSSMAISDYCGYSGAIELLANAQNNGQLLYLVDPDNSSISLNALNITGPNPIVFNAAGNSSKNHVTTNSFTVASSQTATLHNIGERLDLGNVGIGGSSTILNVNCYTNAYGAGQSASGYNNPELDLGHVDQLVALLNGGGVISPTVPSHIYAQSGTTATGDATLGNSNCLTSGIHYPQVQQTNAITLGFYDDDFTGHAIIPGGAVLPSSVTLIKAYTGGKVQIDAN